MQTITTSARGLPTAAEIASQHNLSGRSVLITGGATGIGLETVRALAGIGARVIIGAVDVLHARRAIDGIPGTIEIDELDLGCLSSVRRFAERWRALPLHTLMNNAGVMWVPFGRTFDGFERHMAINYLGHALLTILLTPALRSGSPSRVISLSSVAHRRAPIVIEDMDWAARVYDKRLAYGESKTAVALFTLAFDRRNATHGVRAFSVMPGVIRTGLLDLMTADESQGLVDRLRRAERSAEQGAATSVWAAISTELEGKGGIYLENCGEASLCRDDIEGEGYADHIRNVDIADQLWEKTLKLVGC